ncbi:MAG: Tyrosine--tRNA ligase [Frankiales bacterium]|jgi:tyrosyl-tRNA synthetase|nr:Tyrosine--tRNA ligase [Frankiales bacterium]
MNDILGELSWRGLIAQTTDLDALRRDLAAGPLTLYCGFDPTAESLHVGNLMPLLTLRRFQLAGHRPIALAGGATGFVGDPSGRDSERTLMDAETIKGRVGRIRAQMERFLDFGDGPTDALMVDNLDWTGQMSAIEFLRDVGKHFSVNVMLQRESVSARLEGGGLSYTEFSYVLLQSNDYRELYRRYGCRLQVGGNDQWGNITAGLDLIRRTESGSGHALTVPLVTSATGQKFGKSTGGGSLWLDPAMTSPYALYQYFLNTDDRDVSTYLRYLTFLPREEIEALDAAVAERPHAREAQRRLAEEIVALVHGRDEVGRVQAASAALFGGGALEGLDEPTLAAALAEAPSVSVAGEVPPLVDLLAEGLSLSKSDARRAVRDGGAYLNNARVTDEAAVPGEGDWLHGRFLVLRRGKRSVAVVERAKA